MFLKQTQKEYLKFSLKVSIFIILCSSVKHTFADTRPLDRNAYTIYYNNSPANKTGHFSFDFQTSNGITTKAAGNEYGMSGVVQYISLEGLPITMTYVADGDGYHPNGEHIPKIPHHIVKSLEYIRTHPAVDEKNSRRFKYIPVKADVFYTVWQNNSTHHPDRISKKLKYVECCTVEGKVNLTIKV